MDARLYLIAEAAAEAVVEPALAGGVDIVQLRDKEAADEEIVAAGRRFRSICERHGALLIVNDRADLALACGAHGVHVGQDDEPVESVRTRVGEMIIGISTHSRAQVDEALRSGADYLGVGPVFETATKPGVPAVGLELVRYAREHAGATPWFAIGGIDAANAASVIDAGARRIAVVRAIRDAADPRAAARAMREALEREPAGRGVR